MNWEMVNYFLSKKKNTFFLPTLWQTAIIILVNSEISSESSSNNYSFTWSWFS